VLAAAAALALSPPASAGGQGGDARAAPYDISILYGGAPLPKQETLNLLIARYGRSHANARIEIINVAGNYPARLRALAAANSLGDVMRLDDDWTGEQMVNQNVIDLTDRVRRDLRLEDFFLQSWVPFTYKARVYGVPWDAAVDVIFYNRSQFGDAGVAEPSRDPARWTSDVFLAAAQKLTRDSSGHGRIDRWGFTYPAATTGYAQAQHALWREGATLYDRDKTRVTMHQDPAAVRALQAFVDIRNRHRAAPPIDIANRMGAAAMFPSGVVSMMLNGNSELPNAERARASGIIDYAIAAMPAGSHGPITRVTCDGWGITRNARGKDRAWDLIRWMSSDDGQALVGANGSFTPVLKKAALSDAYRNNPATSYDEGLLAEMVEKNALIGEICLQGAEVAEAWARATDGLWLGREDALAAARRYNELMIPILAKEAPQRPFAPSYVRSYGELVR
jgi:multiple sugar transport system substrate-binding protein